MQGRVFWNRDAIPQAAENEPLSEFREDSISGRFELEGGWIRVLADDGKWRTYPAHLVLRVVDDAPASIDGPLYGRGSDD